MDGWKVDMGRGFLVDFSRDCTCSELSLLDRVLLEANSATNVLALWNMCIKFISSLSVGIFRSKKEITSEENLRTISRVIQLR